MGQRWQRILIWGSLLFWGGLIVSAVAYWLISQPFFRRPVLSTATINWATLPTPIKTDSHWTSYTNSDTINDILQVGDLLWVGTDGGLVVHALTSGQQVKFTSEHGLAGNVVQALDVGRDNAIWVGTASGGVSRYDSRSWQTFTHENGLSHNEVRDIAVTQDGAVWVATADGLNRYDGERWITFNPLNTVFGLPSQNIRSITAVPNSNHLWAATDRGLTFYDGRRWQAQTFSSSGLGSDNVFGLDSVPDGTLWIAHQAGLQRLAAGRWQQFTMAEGLLDSELGWLTAVSQNEVWFGYRDENLPVAHFKEERGVLSITHFDVAAGLPEAAMNRARLINQTAYIGTENGLFYQQSGQFEKINLPSDIPDHSINSLIAARGALWTAGEFGVGRFDGSTWQQFGQQDGLLNAEVTQLAVGPNQTPYATYGVAGMGLSRFQSSGRWESIACPINGPHSTRIYDGIRDQAGGFWFSSNRGVIHFDQSNWEIFTPFHGLPNGRVWDIDQAADGTIWVGSQFGVAFYDGNQWHTIPGENVQQIAVSSNNIVWALMDDQIMQVQGDKLVFISSLPFQNIGQIDATRDALWVGTSEGVARLDAQNGQFRTYSVGEGLPFNRTPVVWVDANDTVWAVSESGTQNSTNGYFIPNSYNLRYVSRLDSDVWQPTLIADQNQPLHGVITSITHAPDQSIWAATLAGLSHFDGDQWRSYTVANGLLAFEIYDLTVDETGVWAASENGVVQLLPHQEETFIAVNRLGWRSEEFLRIELETAPDGTIWASNGRALYQFINDEWRTIPLDSSLGDIRLDNFTFDTNGRLWGSAFLQGEVPAQTQRLFIGTLDGHSWKWQPVTAPTLPEPNSLQTLAFAPNGTLWAASTNGVWVFDVTRANFGDAIQGYRNPIEHITDIAFMDNGMALLTSRLSAELITISPDGAQEFLPLPIPSATGAHGVTVDEAGVIWIGTNQGIARLEGTRWEVFPAPAESVEGVTMELNVVAPGEYWLGTSQGQTIQYQNGSVRRLPIFSDDRSDERPFTISSLFPEPDGEVWISSYEGGVARLEGLDWNRLGSSASLFEGDVQTVTFVGETAWIGTSDGLVTRNVLTGESCEFLPDLLWEDTQLALTAADQSLWFLGGQVVYYWEEGTFQRGGYQALPAAAAGLDGSIWFATIQGVMRHENGRSRQLITDLPTIAPINVLAIDHNNLLWMGTEAGVFTFHQQGWQQLGSEQGLANNNVSHIAFDADNSIWFATEGGISHYQP